jgi:hypothetical protein
VLRDRTGPLHLMHGGALSYSFMTILPGRNTAYSHRHAADNPAVIIPSAGSPPVLGSGLSAEEAGDLRALAQEAALRLDRTGLTFQQNHS